MSISNNSKINQLLTNGRYQGLYFSEWLKKQGYSNQLLKKYRESGWLVSLARGVMYRKEERLSAITALASFNIQMKKQFRIAAHSGFDMLDTSQIELGTSKLQRQVALLIRIMPSVYRIKDFAVQAVRLSIFSITTCHATL